MGYRNKLDDKEYNFILEFERTRTPKTIFEENNPDKQEGKKFQEIWPVKTDQVFVCVHIGEF